MQSALSSTNLILIQLNVFMSFRRVQQESWLTSPSPQEQSPVGRSLQRETSLTTSCSLTLNWRLKPVKQSMFLKKQMQTTQKEKVSLSRRKNPTQNKSYSICHVDCLHLHITVIGCYSGGDCQWGDNLSFEPRPSSPDTIPEPWSSASPTSNSPDAPKPAAVALNRFMVSRFSITHVSDPHMGSATGPYSLS